MNIDGLDYNTQREKLILSEYGREIQDMVNYALTLKDNRAFCKYICPITVFLKPMSYFSWLRIKCDEEK